MSWFRRFTNLLRPNALNEELDQEMRFHLESRIQENDAEGMSPATARESAMKRFGNPAAIKEKSREADLLNWLETATKDLSFAVRDLRKNPGFASAAVLTLALGVGANTAIFSVVKAVLLDHLPYRQPDRLIMIASTSAPKGSVAGVTVDFTTASDWSARSRYS